MAVSTQGTMLYALVPTAADPDVLEVLRVACPKNLNTGGTPVDEIDTTCLEAYEREYIAGLGNPDTATFDIDADPRNPSHVRLFQLSQPVPGEERPVIKWAVGWPDGTDAPTLNTEGDDFELPATRTWYTFQGYISNFPFDFQVNAAVASTISVRRSGAGVWTVKTA